MAPGDFCMMIAASVTDSSAMMRSRRTSRWSSLRPSKGLSYSTVESSNLRLDGESIGLGGTLRATITLTNTGNRPATETVQAYISDNVTSVMG
ncbi:glycoside hydrolase family 3 domain protein [Arthrobacter sp. Hiyo4]|nr:glycoside hydrolase family 3 domain protein [Arthrobacter sp. Hiyo4]